MGSALSVSSPNPVLPFVPEPPVAFQQFRLVSIPPRSCPKCPHPSPLLPTQHLHSQRGGTGSQKGEEQEGGLGQQEFKTNNKKEDQERRKKKTTTKKQEALGADSTRKEKKPKKTRNQKDPLLEKKKKVLCTFSKFCGETSRYWALFSKMSKFFNLLQMCVFCIGQALFWKL